MKTAESEVRNIVQALKDSDAKISKLPSLEGVGEKMISKIEEMKAESFRLQRENTRLEAEVKKLKALVSKLRKDVK